MTDDDAPQTRRDGPRWQHRTADASPSTPLRAESAFDASSQRFEMGDELGRGGMGRVVAARDTRLDRTVAIKQALAADDENLARFEREVRITAKLEHPSIVPVHDVGRDQAGRPFYIMRRIDGEPLSTRVASARDLRARIALVPNVLAAVDAAAFAHARGVIHRDIKPWNILIGAYGETLLIDWGLARELAEADVPSGNAKPADPTLTHAGNALGTPGYMAPEQVRGERTDARADVYSLGVTLFHVLAGAPPFDGMTPDDWLARAQKKPLAVPLDRLSEDVPRELVTIVAKATAIDPSARYRDAGELAGDLRAFLAGQLVAAHHYSTWERLRRWVRKHRIAVATAVVAFVALVAVGVFAIVNVVRERDTAANARQIAADRAEKMLLERASMLASRDPTRAVALLRDLAPSSPHLRRARDIAAVADAHGIAHGMRVHRSAIRALALSTDGKQLASGAAGGSLQILDLATRTSRTLTTGNPIWQIAWVANAASLVYMTSAGVEQYDLANGVHRILIAGAKTFWKVDELRIRYQLQGALYELGPDGSKTIAEDVGESLGVGEVAVVDGGGRLRSIDASGEHELARGTASSIGVISSPRTLSSDGRRFAAIVAGALVEWDTHTGAELRRFDARSIALFYFDDRLYSRPAGEVGLLEVFPPWGGRNVALIRGTYSWQLVTDGYGGSVLVADDGLLAVARGGLIYRFALDPLAVRAIAASPASPIFAAGTEDGVIRWWDLRTFIPETVPMPRSSTLCGIDRENIYTHAGLDITAIPRAGGEPRELATGPYENCAATGRGAVGMHMPLDPSKDDIIDSHTKAVLPVERGVVVDTDTGSLFHVVDQKTVVEITTRDETRERLTAPEPLAYMSARNGWLAVATRDRHVIRIDPTGKQTTSQLDRPVDRFVIAPNGDLWFASGEDILHSDGKAIRQVATLPAGILELGSFSDGTAGVLGKDGSLWQITLEGHVLRAPPGQRVGSLGPRFATSVDGGYNIETTYMETGERSIRLAPDLIFKVVHGADAVAAQTTSKDGVTLVYTERVPRDPAALQAWIDSVTNARVGPSDLLVWR